MLRPSIVLAALFLPAVAAAQTPQDSPVTQALLTEIRQLRQDLQNTASVIQRIQIAMFRLQAESSVLNAATQRADQARDRCSQAQAQRKNLIRQVEQNEARQRDSSNPAVQKNAQESLVWLKPAVEEMAAEEGRCAARQMDAENQLRAEQAKIADLQDRLDKLDKALSAPAGK